MSYEIKVVFLICVHMAVCMCVGRLAQVGGHGL